MYELSTVPEHLPGGGGWSIKNFNLTALFTEHLYGRNLWTKTNTDLSLARYTGCSIRLYQAEKADYVFTYSTQLPMTSTMGMYNTMQPSIHNMLQHKILIPSRQTYPKKKPYTKLKIKPPAPLQNKWYFQQDIAKIPLLMTRCSAISLQHYYLDPKGKSTNITIPFLNTSLIQNRQFKTLPGAGYSPKGEGTQKVYLYSTHSTDNITRLKWQDVILLADTTKNEPGMSYTEAKQHDHTITQENWPQKAKQYRGNPFYADYLQNHHPVYQSTEDYSTQLSNWTVNKENTPSNFTQVFLTDAIRYNPLADANEDNMCYFLPATKDEKGWDPPNNEELINRGLPLWLLLWGFPDWQKKIKKQLHIDDSYILVIQTKYTRPIRQILVPINESWIEGYSPYENEPNRQDYNRWWPSFQFQEITINNICESGPGTPKVPDNTNIEAHLHYTFYFKWGGNLPPMSTIEDPREQPTYPLPNNNSSRTSLQNPETDPATLLHQFDERRGTLTKKAIRRLQKDSETKTSFISDGTTSHFSTPIQAAQETSETDTSEEEETETLIDKLQQQYRKQRLLKLRIKETMKHLQSLE